MAAYVSSYWHTLTLELELELVVVVGTFEVGGGGVLVEVLEVMGGSVVLVVFVELGRVLVVHRFVGVGVLVHDVLDLWCVFDDDDGCRLEGEAVVTPG